MRWIISPLWLQQVAGEPAWWSRLFQNLNQSTLSVSPATFRRSSSVKQNQEGKQAVKNQWIPLLTIIYAAINLSGPSQQLWRCPQRCLQLSYLIMMLSLLTLLLTLLLFSCVGLWSCQLLWLKVALSLWPLPKGIFWLACVTRQWQDCD